MSLSGGAGPSSLSFRFSMKIKRIDIVGFKSFVDKVSLDFQEGVTGIVGPNGCGKSNIVDAIRWAMGEQSAKNLRGRSMEDVIFGGSESRKPHGMAEVTMVFGNEAGLAPPAFRDYAEIMVTRRLYRNGESDYLLNKTPCRLLDISELFMDTGVGRRAYSIIEQGKIGMILNAKPEDRRFLIEEAAGVTKYKSRKKTAIRKIELTRQNLLRLGDIIAEVRRQLGSLKRQAQRAERFRQFREELKGIETIFAQRRYRELREALEKATGEERAQAEDLEGATTELQSQELRLDELKLRQVEAEKDVTAAQERVYHIGTQIQQLEDHLEFGARDRENLGRQQERLATEQLEVGNRLGVLETESDQLLDSARKLAGELAQASRVLTEAEVDLNELSRAEAEASARLETARKDLFGIVDELTRLHNQQEDARRRIELVEERIGRNRQEAVRLQEQALEVRSQAEVLTAQLTASRTRHQELQSKQENASRELARLRQALDTNENELHAAREALSRVRSEPDWGSRFRGVAADYLQVPAEYELAVEAVLGERLQALPVARVEDAGRAMDFLRENGGRSTFLLPISATNDPPAVSAGKPLAALVDLQAGAPAPLTGLLQGVYLVDSLASWLNGGLPWGVTLVTTQGEVLSASGELSGGSSRVLGEGLLHQKREMKELAGQVELGQDKLLELQAERERQQDALRQVEARLQDLSGDLRDQEISLVNSDKDLVRLRQEDQRLQERIEVLGLEADQLAEERSLLERRQVEAASGHAAQGERKTALERDLAEAQGDLQQQRLAVGVARDRLTGLKVQVASLREREDADRRSREGLENLRSELQGRLTLLKGQQQDAVEQQNKLEAELERKRVELEVFYTRREEEKRGYDRLRDGFETLSSQLAEQDELLRVLRQRVVQAHDLLSGLQLGAREKELEMGHLRQSFHDKYRFDLDREPAVPEEEFDQAAARRRQDDLLRQIEAIGEVNLTAIEEYRELEERHAFLSSQQEDLNRSLQGLQEAIAKINRTTRKRFRETFDQVNGKFQEIFPRLFRGGRAELRLTDEEDLLETGIDIIAQPPGKKLQNVGLLSGGEKALTAVALIFSIFLVKPSPFCLLDEVDAPLDDANIGRFNEMVKEMSAISQFIIITHNKRTMEIADPLYGVTMEEPGVSKLVSVRVNEFQG